MVVSAYRYDRRSWADSGEYKISWSVSANAADAYDFSPMYVCATASIPIAASFVALGVHPAAALVFLIAGPATNAAAILPLVKVLGLRHVLIQLIVVIVGSITGAYFFSDYLKAEVFTDHCHDHTEWYQLLAAGLLLLVFIRGAYMSFMNSRTPQSSGRWSTLYVLP